MTIEDNNKTFNEKLHIKNAASFHNNKSFLVKDPNTIQENSMVHFNTMKKKKIIKPKCQNAIKKTHTKGINSVYMKGFDKLMKERHSIERKSIKRIKCLRASDDLDTIPNAKTVMIPPPK